jgi:hypothetical protein
MKEKDKVERIEHIAKTKIEMQLAREQGIKAQEDKKMENALNAEKMKEIMIENEKKREI